MPPRPAGTRRAAVIPIDSGGHRDRFLRRRDALVEEHAELVVSIARRIAESLPPSFELDDLIATGQIALIQAATRYRPGEHGGTPFSAYARYVVRGAILDSVRRRHYAENTRPAIDEDHDEASPAPDHDAEIDTSRLSAKVHAAVQMLPKQQRRVLLAYYSPAEPSLSEVGRRLGIGATRASQIHAEALDAVRRIMAV